MRESLAQVPLVAFIPMLTSPLTVSARTVERSSHEGIRLPSSGWLQAGYREMRPSDQ
jgi:hypothetical protein